jgi:hypothetical protein
MADVKLLTSMVDPGCLSRIPDPDFYPSRIPDPKTAMKDGGEKNLLSNLFFGVINFTKLNYFIFEMSKKIIWANFQRIIELFTQKFVTTVISQKNGFGIRDPRSGKSLFRIPDPRVKKAPDRGSRTLLLTHLHNTHFNAGTSQLCSQDWSNISRT